MAEKVVYPADSVDDYWHGAVQVLTGYVPPTREMLFGNLLGNNDIPLMRVEISDYDGEPSNAIVSASDDLDWLYKSSGWRVENTDVVIPFYSGKHGSVGDAGVGTKVVMKKARITMLGHKGSTKDSGATAGVFMGGKFKSGTGKDFKGQAADTEWDSAPLTQYAFGGGMALYQLMDSGKTTDFSWNGIKVANENAVDLDSFDENAKAFDRVAQFFNQRHSDLQDWEFDLGDEEAAWKGQAAGVFYDLIHGLKRTYKSYSDQFAVSGTANSKLGDDLRAYRVGVYNAALSLYNEWNKWTVSSANPLIWLTDILEEVAKEVWYNNIVKVRYKPGLYSRFSTNGHHKVEFGGFYGGDRKYGPLEEMETWKKIGEEAISRWQQRVKDVLVVAGKQALMDLENTFMDHDFPKKIDTETVSLTEKFGTDQAADEKAEQEKKEKEAQEKQEQKEKEQEAKQEEKEKEQEAKQAEQEAKQEAKEKEQEAKQEQKEREQEAKQEQLQQEQDAKQAEQEAKQEQKEKEQEAKQEQLQQEQDAKQAEQEAKQEQKEKEQEAKQDQLQQEQDAKQAEQEAKQEQKEKEQEAKQDQLQQEQDAKQAEQEAKQEQKEKEAEQQQLIATNQARMERDQQKKEQERKESEQEAKQAEKEAEQEAKQAEQEAKQEQKEKEAEQKQAEQEQKQIKTESEFQAKQDQQQKEQEARQEQLQQEQDAKQAEQEAKQEQKEKEQEAKQEQLQQEQDAKQAEQEAKQEQKEKEQEAKQEQLQQEQDAKQAEQEAKQEQKEKEAQERFDQQAGGLGLGGAGLGGGDLLGQDSATTTLNPDGSVTMDFPDGTSRTLDPPSGDVTTTFPDGSTDVDSLGPGGSIANSDGSTSTLNPDGTLTTTFPDGSSSVVNPDLGTITSHQPDGTTITTPIDRGETLPSELGGSSGLGGGTSGLGSSGDSVYSPSYDTSDYEEELYDGTLEHVDPSEYGMGAGNGAGGMPMMPGRMGGMGGGGASEGERVRGVMDDGQPITTRRSSPQTGRGGYQEEELIPAASRSGATASSGMPFMPPMGGAGGQGQETQSSDRERSSWVEEDDDVWGTDAGGAPAVIGR
ncbi:AAWKG family protein [Streptomyces sp. WSLK1-5]|uniref:AAWKG family protein n=1 Tax=unclassified Streptomyces TaxID=2593676 RepID=UPI003791C5FE